MKNITVERNVDYVAYRFDMDTQKCVAVKEKFWSPDKGTYYKYNCQVIDGGRMFYTTPKLAEKLYNYAKENI